MTSDDLTDEQAKVLAEKFGVMLQYLARVEKRMKERGFRGTDPLRVSLNKAQGELQGLVMKCHYLTCKEQTWGKRK